MRKRHFDVETDGFYGAYWKCKTGSDCAMIAMIGDDPEDYLARTSVKWLHKLGVNVMTMSPAKKDYGHHNYPLERIEKAISWLKIHGNQKIGIVGASTTGTLALTAASYFKDITLTIGLTPSDFIWQGFMQGKRDGCKEWPMEGESLFSYKEEPLPYMPFCYKHPDYWHVIEKETKRTGDMINSRKLFDDSEKAHFYLVYQPDFFIMPALPFILIIFVSADQKLNHLFCHLNQHFHSCQEHGQTHQEHLSSSPRQAAFYTLQSTPLEFHKMLLLYFR